MHIRKLPPTPAAPSESELRVAHPKEPRGARSLAQPGLCLAPLLRILVEGFEGLGQEITFRLFFERVVGGLREYEVLWV